MTRFACAFVSALVAVVAIVTTALDARADGCEAETTAVRAMSRPDPALAPPTDATAKAHMSAGNKRHRVQEYDLAVAEYKAGALIAGDPIFLYNLGQAYRLGGDYDKAIRQYRLFLDRGAPGAQLRALVECHIAAMARELDQAASKEQPTGPAPDGAEGRIVAPPNETEAREPPRVTVDVAPWYADRWGLVLTGSGIAAGAVGVVLLLDASSLADEAEREDREDIRNELRDRSESRQLWGTVVTAVGVVGLALGVVKLAITPDAPERGSLSLVVGPGQFALAGTW